MTDDFPEGGSRCVAFCAIEDASACAEAHYDGCSPSFPGGLVALADGTLVGACVPRDDDEDGTPLPFDCADGDPLREPGNVEVCDAVHRDEDCDPATPPAVDADDDGYVTRCCNGAGCGSDCNDTPGVGANIHPGAVDVPCDGIDSNCDWSPEGFPGDECNYDEECCSGECNLSDTECL